MSIQEDGAEPAFGNRKPPYIHEQSRPALSPPDRPTIAVLPFVNMSGDPEQAYFSDGISEDIITALSKLRWFFVIARNSSFIFKGRAVHMKQVAEELGVGYVVEGSVRKDGDRVRITTQLSDAATGTQIWAERYDRDLVDVFGFTTRSLRPSSPRSSRSSMPRRTFAPIANPRITWTQKLTSKIDLNVYISSGLAMLIYR